MSSLSSLPRRSNLLRLFFLLIIAGGTAEGTTRNNGMRSKERRYSMETRSFSIDKGDSHSQRRSGQRELNGDRKNLYYEFLEGSSQTYSKSSLSDVWLCLACALGSSIWLMSTRQQSQEIVFEQQDSKKAMGHVLQVSLGEDILGTGIPVYYAVIDYVVAGDTDEDHIQVRKVFTSKKLLEEGFANVEVLYLTDDPTTAILMDEFLDQKKEGENQSQSSTSTAHNMIIFVLSVVLIATSVFGGVRMASRLETPLYGWISLGIGLLLLYPAAKFLFRFVTYLYSLAGPMTERPGVIVYGKRLYWANKCHATLNPMEIIGADKKTDSDRSIELPDLQVPRLDRNARGRSSSALSTTPKLFPNAGCGFGNFNVHLPSGRPRTNSSVSSISASASQNSGSGTGSKIVRNDTSILEKYDMHEGQGK